VTVSNFAFTPSALTIAVGDSVKWTNVAALTPHTATDDGAAWGTGTLSASGGTKTLGFVSAASYQYHCAFHALSMTATLDVQIPVSVDDGEPVAPAATWGRIKMTYGAR
jgi:plastocyanin